MTQKNVDIDGILQAVTEAECLGNSTRQYDLLKYLLVEQSEGRGKRVKAYSIAIDVLGRDEDFDNSVDSIVRVEMHRLRKNLALFNQISSELSLTIPKATYSVEITTKPEVTNVIHIPEKGEGALIKNTFNSIFGIPIIGLGLLGVFLYGAKLLNGKTGTIAEDCSRLVPNLLLMPTNIVGDTKLKSGANLVLDNYLQTGLAQYSMIKLTYYPNTCEESYTQSYRLIPEIFSAAEHNFVSIRVQNVETQNVIYVEKIKFNKAEEALPEHLEWAVYTMASKIAHASGFIPRDAIAFDWQDKDAQYAYSCRTFAFKYSTVHLVGNNYQETVQCMQTAIENGSQNVSLYGMLAAYYMDQIRGYQVVEPAYVDDHLKKAIDLLDRAEEMDPYDVSLMLARLRLLRLDRENNMQELRHLVNTIERKQPYNPSVLRIAALVTGFVIGDWEHANRMSEVALKLDHASSNQYYYIQFSYALLYSSPEEAFEISTKLFEAKSRVALIMCLAGANKAGEKESAIFYKQHLSALGLNTEADYREYLHTRDWEPKIHAEVLKWLN